MPKLLTHGLYPLAVGGSLLLFALGLQRGWPLEPLLLVWSLLLLATGVMLERHLPHEPRRSHDAGEARVDATSAIVLVALADPLLKAATALLAAALAGAPDASSWPMAHWPLALQVAAAVLWMELAKYASHRAHHAWSGLWPLHALHHSSQRLYWLNNLRIHPLNHAINTLAALVPLALLGVPQTVLIGALAFTQPVVLLQHLNARTDSGLWNWIFSTHELHRWHHSAEPSQANANYGSALVIWDQLFGTFRPEALHQQPERIGLFASSLQRYPARASYWQQLLAPFTPPCCRAA